MTLIHTATQATQATQTDPINGAVRSEKQLSLADSANIALLKRSDSLETLVRAQINEIENKNEGITQLGRIEALLITLPKTLTAADRTILQTLNIQNIPSDGRVTSSNVTALSTSIKNTKESLTSVSQLDTIKLQSLNGKFEQANSLASQIMKSLFMQAQSIIRNIS
ncbi:MAG: hypothetical protein HAW62_04895 [Endozoicomonadaceae bacterium]|nr:hypothetical protein [Endozoicomonadaceae bacterium]